MPRKILQNLIADYKQHPTIFKIAFLVLLFYLKAEPGFLNLSHFSFDQGEDIILTKNLVVDHKLSLISRGSGLEGVMMGPGFTWFLAVPFMLSGGDPNFNVVFLALISSLMAVVTYLVIKRLADQRLALLAFLFVALSPSFVAAPKVVFSPTPLLFLAPFYFWWLYEIIFKGHDKYLAPLLFLISLFFHFEIAYAIFAFTTAVLIIWFYKRLKPFWGKNGLRSLVGFGLPFLPQLVFDFRHNFLISRSLLAFFAGKNQSLGSSQLSFFERIPARFFSLWEDFQGTIYFYPKSSAVNFLVLAIFSVGWYLIFKHKQRTYLKLGALLILIISLTYAGFIIYPGPIWAWYRASLPFFFGLLFCLSISEIFSQKSKSVKLFTFYFLLFTLIISFQLQTRFHLLQGKYPGNVSTVKNQQIVLDYLYQQANGEPFSLYIYTPPVYPNIWDYQLSWYAKKKYGYLPKIIDVMPQSGNPENIFLLIETDVEYPTNIIGWRDNFTHFGHPVESSEFDFGVRVEKWRFNSEPVNFNPLIREVNVFH